MLQILVHCLFCELIASPTHIGYVAHTSQSDAEPIQKYWCLKSESPTVKSTSKPDPVLNEQVNRI